MGDLSRNRQKLHPQAVKALQQQRQALELRKGGASYLEIGEALGVKKTRAYNIVMLAVDDMKGAIREDAATVRHLEAGALGFDADGIVAAEEESARGKIRCCGSRSAERACLAWTRRLKRL